MLYLPRNVGETLLGHDKTAIWLVEKQHGESLRQRMAHYVKGDNEFLYDERGKLGMLSELLLLRAQEGRHLAFIPSIKRNTRAYHPNPLTEILVDALLIDSCFKPKKKSENHALGYDIVDITKANLLIDPGFAINHEELCSLLPEDYAAAEVVKENPDSPFNQMNLRQRPAGNARWVDSLRYLHYQFSTDADQQRFEELCKSASLKHDLRRELIIKIEKIPEAQIAEARMLNGAVEALIGEAWFEAQEIARDYIKSGKPVFAKVEGVQAVALTDPPQKLLETLRELARQRDAARAKHGIDCHR